ncbi:ABC transporter ATP-binding protein [Bradyrhizobium sp.]|uniref:ABC transporter ATP-binding protein n=1 Tax=Bradyrhizobium sp. TaxID=376 RepID=UPI0025BF6406|nr:ABC transporter ATP-binding protein [Bradyrhizobium sp.]
MDIAASPPPGTPPATLLAFYRYFLAEHKRILGWLFLCGFGVACADALVSVFVGKVVAFVGQTDRWKAWHEYWPTLLAFLIAIGIARPLLIYFDLRLRNAYLAPGVTSRIRWVSHWHVVRQSWQFFQGDFPGRLAHRVMHTAGSLRETAEAAIRAVWYLAMYGGACIFLLGEADWRLTLPLLCWFAGYIALLGWFVPRLKTRAEGSSQAYSDLMAAIVDCYSNILTVKLFSYEATDKDHVRNALLSHDDAQLRHAQMITRFMTALTLLNTVLLTGTGAIAVALWVNAAIEAEAVAMALPLVWQAASTGGWVAWEVSGIFQNLADVKQGMASIAAPNTMVDAPDARPLDIKAGAIEFDGIDFGYSGERPLFAGFSLAIAPGERVGLVGRSGAGKSTLVSLLLRLYDIKGGAIRVDGQDIRAASMDSLRSRIGVVTQDTALLHRSIGDNILCGKPDASRDELVRALGQSRVSEFIDGLLDEEGRAGLEASAGERGAKLSGGQRQRIVLARVLLKNAPILVLDEATAALDSEAEHAIQEQLDTLMTGKTVITIAHRLSTLARMDRIVVLDGGRIVEQGSHDRLIALGGLYASLWRHQTGGRLPGGEHSSFVRPPEDPSH